MSQTTPSEPGRFQKGTVPSGPGTWLLLAGFVYLAIGTFLTSQPGATTTSPGTTTILMVLATLTGAAGAVALLRTPSAPPTLPFVGVSVAVASILAMTPVIGGPEAMRLPVFVLDGAWQYALTPLVFHFALSVGWPHRQRNWSGVVASWYILHALLFIAAAVGLATGEMPLFEVVDPLVRRTFLEPFGVLASLAALGMALASPFRRGAQRRATAWAFAAILLGMGPAVVSQLVPSLAQPFDGAMSVPRLALTLVVFLGLTAVAALPLVNPNNRDLQAHRLAQQFLDNEDLHATLAEMATVLRNTFEADGVQIRLTSPQVNVSDGEIRPIERESIAPETEALDDHRTLAAPIGRSSDPLGEVRLHARYAGAFGRREREWVTAFLLPIGTALRARKREAAHKERAASMQRNAAATARELAAVLERLPASPVDDGFAVPPPVDASEVLGQLRDGLDGVSRRTDDLEIAAGEGRLRMRDASDQVAQALDTLRAFTADLLRLGTWHEVIAASNQSVSGVAFRTNLLANNAALEATRAGSAGKTFGVLAEEIRRLADAATSSSEAIEEATKALSEELASRVAALEALQTSLVSAIRESESGEEAARQVTDIAGAVLSYARSLHPAVEEAYAVARRRSARDEKLTTTTERLLTEREQMARALSEHRIAVQRLSESLNRLGR